MKEKPDTGLREWARRAPVRGTVKCTLLGLVMHSNEKGSCWPSLKTLSNTIGLGVSAVKAGISELQQEGLITITRRNKCKTGRNSNLYQLNFKAGYGRHAAIPPNLGMAATRPRVWPPRGSKEPTEEPIKDLTPLPPLSSGHKKRQRNEPMWVTATRNALERTD